MFEISRLTNALSPYWSVLILCTRQVIPTSGAPLGNLGNMEHSMPNLAAQMNQLQLSGSVGEDPHNTTTFWATYIRLDYTSAHVCTSHSKHPIWLATRTNYITNYHCVVNFHKSFDHEMHLLVKLHQAIFWTFLNVVWFGNHCRSVIYLLITIFFLFMYLVNNAQKSGLFGRTYIIEKINRRKTNKYINLVVFFHCAQYRSVLLCHLSVHFPSSPFILAFVISCSCILCPKLFVLYFGLVMYIVLANPAPSLGT